jgi:GT2 family glycosyltransferase
MNIGAKIALHYDAELLIFLSNDVSVTGNFVAQMQRKVTENPNSLIGGEVIYWPGGWNEFTVEGKKFVVPYANGWLLACTAGVWKTIGGFDPIYSPYDYEDIDLSTSAIANGYAIIGLNSEYVRHAHQGSTISTTGKGQNRLEHTKQNRLKYEEKWLGKLDSIMVENSDGRSGSR